MSLLTTFIIADLNLISYEGHNAEYSLNLQSEAKKQGIRCLVWGNIRMDPRIVERGSAKPLFHLTYGVALTGPPLFRLLSDVCFFFGWRPQFLRHREARATFCGHDKSLYNDLQQIKQNTPIDSDTFILFHTIQPPQIEPVCRWLEGFSAAGRPHVGLLFRFEPNCETDHPVRSPGWTRRAYDLLREVHPAGKVHLLSDSEVLRQRYEALTRCPVSVVPIPQSASRFPLASDSALRRTIRFGYLGNARDSKGFPQLPKLVIDCAELISVGGIEFVFQLYHSSNYEAASEAAIDALKKLRVTPFLGELDSDRYYRLLQLTDVVLLPYDLNYYKSQTSGVFSDALAYGKVVVVPKDTWMADQLQNYGAGVIYDSKTADGLLGAVGEVIDRYEELQTKAIQGVPSWASKHSARRYLEQIIKCMTKDISPPASA